jgi:exodeoxyribonuclease-1
MTFCSTTETFGGFFVMLICVMANTFYFYDLETTGFNARDARIMQFAGQRTDMDLNPIGEPHDILVKITSDILPDPGAILVTGITPQKTLQDGMSEADFLKIFHSEISIPNTIFVGFNSVRFDDEFIRFTNYRNFYDPYEWQWQDGRSRWDIMDLARVTRALRPEGITWPFASDGRPANKLELIASVNKLEHAHAHDALSDVIATIEVAKLIKQKQPKLFDFMLKMRDKKEVQKLAGSGEPFVYCSGRYPSEFEKTTVVMTAALHPTQSGSVFVYDLRENPEPFLKMTPTELADLIKKWKFEEGELRLPVKQLQFNKCPAIAPIQVLEVAGTKERLGIDDTQIQKHLSLLRSSKDFGDKIQEAVRMNEKQKQAALLVDVQDVDAQLYDGFFADSDKSKMRTVRSADENALADLHLDFADERLTKLLLLYKARQFPKSLSEQDQQAWEEYRSRRLFDGDQKSRFALYLAKITELAANPSMTNEQKYLLEELSLYAQSLAPYSL